MNRRLEDLESWNGPYEMMDGICLRTFVLFGEIQSQNVVSMPI